MRLRVGFSWVQIEESTPAELSWVTDYLTFRSYDFSLGSTAESLVKPGGFFPAGLAERVIQAARRSNLTVEVVYRADNLTIDPDTSFAGKWTARPHQVEALGILQTQHRGIVQHATGTGKSDMIGFLTCLIHGRVLVIATSKKLQEDLVQRCQKFEVRAGRLGGGFRPGPRDRVVVAVVNSLPGQPDSFFDRFDAVLADEVHGAASQGYNEAVMRCKNAGIRLGFSATPMSRADKRSLWIVGAFGEVLHTYSPEQAADDKVIARGTVAMHGYSNPNVSLVGGYVAWAARAIGKDTDRNLLIRRLVFESQGPRIVFVRTHEHQHILRKLIGEDKCTIVNDRSTPYEMKSAIKVLRDGRVPTLISSPIFRQGVDIPELQSVIMAAGGKAVVDTIQKVGRACRRMQPDGTEKETFQVHDIADRGCGCQGLHKGCVWHQRHTRERLLAYRAFGYSVIEQ